MEYTYALETLDLGNGQTSTFVRRFPDEAIIPIDTDNGDYRVYLAWAEENQPAVINHVTKQGV